MKIAFMGSDPIALPLLDLLFDGKQAEWQLAAVFTQPDRRSGRGMYLTANAIKQWSAERNIPLFQPLKCGQKEADWMGESGIDLVVVMAYGQILPSVFLKKPPLGLVNLHTSLLPRLRGASPIQTAVALGLKETGVSLMRMIRKLDAGPVAKRVKVSLHRGEGLEQVQKQLSEATVRLMESCLPGLASNSLPFLEQEESEATYCRILEKSDANLDFHSPAMGLEQRLRAFHPWPGVSFPYGETEIRIIEAEAESFRSPEGKPGTLERGEDGLLRIACGEGSLRISRLQRPGGKPLPSDAFLRGFPLTPGYVVRSREMRPLESRNP